MGELRKQVGIGPMQAENGDLSDRSVLQIALHVMTEGDGVADTETAFEKLLDAIH